MPYNRIAEGNPYVAIPSKESGTVLWFKNQKSRRKEEEREGTKEGK